MLIQPLSTTSFLNLPHPFFLLLIDSISLTGLPKISLATLAYSASSCALSYSISSSLLTGKSKINLATLAYSASS
jgi:hypothetical protein